MFSRDVKHKLELNLFCLHASTTEIHTTNEELSRPHCPITLERRGILEPPLTFQLCSFYLTFIIHIVTIVCLAECYFAI